jgi:transient receptor potential cation channel subfamily M protein 2
LSQVRDLTWFVVILMVFVAAFAIATEAMLYHAAEGLMSWRLVLDLPRRAYWQIYGELFLDDIEGEILE